jgi:type I restriction enzyme S subunit
MTLVKEVRFKQTEAGVIPEEWKVGTLGNLTDNFDFRRVPIKESERQAGSYPYYGASGVIDYVSEYIFDGEYLLIAEDGENLRTRATPIAFIAGGKFWVNNHAHVVRGNGSADTRFIMYALLVANIDAFLTGTTVPKLSQESMTAIPLPFPSLAEQKSISKILSDLDSRIELNHRMNKTLEAIGRAIFNHWFTDFEFPNKDGGPYKSSGGRMVNHELGKVPAGWKMVNLGEVAENPRRGILPIKIRRGTPYIGLEHMPRRNIALSEWIDGASVVSNKFEFLQGEILFGKLRPYFHKVGVAPVNGVCSTDILVIAPKSPEWYGLVLGHVSSDEFVRYTDAVSTGTKMPRSNWKEMSRYEVAIPPISLAKAFGVRIAPLIQKIRENVLQSRKLSEIRDSLLPRLMSGRIRVPVEVDP